MCMNYDVWVSERGAIKNCWKRRRIRTQVLSGRSCEVPTYFADRWPSTPLLRVIGAHCSTFVVFLVLNSSLCHLGFVTVSAASLQSAPVFATQRKLWQITCTILPIVQSIKVLIIDWDGYIYIYIYKRIARLHTAITRLALWLGSILY